MFFAGQDASRSRWPGDVFRVGTRSIAPAGEQLQQGSVTQRHRPLPQRRRLQEPFDVIVSDLRMPGLAGDRLLAELRERGEDYDDRVIFMTGDALGWESSEIVRSAHHPVLLKPAPPAEVTAAIEQIERRRRGD